MKTVELNGVAYNIVRAGEQAAHTLGLKIQKKESSCIEPRFSGNYFISRCDVGCRSVEGR